LPFFAMLAMGLGALASPAEGAPFAYVTNANSNTVSVTVVGSPIPVGNFK
jgi:hypothetical protein